MRWRRVAEGVYECTGPSGMVYRAEKLGKIWTLSYSHEHIKARAQTPHATLGEAKQAAGGMESFIERQALASGGV